jgi:anti-sigma-K factor RskA
MAAAPSHAGRAADACTAAPVLPVMELADMYDETLAATAAALAMEPAGTAEGVRVTGPVATKGTVKVAPCDA